MATIASLSVSSAKVTTTSKKRDAFGDEYLIAKVVLDKQTLCQRLEILDLVGYGRCLFLDNVIQSAEIDEYVYHESMVHPAMVAHPRPQKVLIIGGGEGGILREVFRHNTVSQVTMGDIDKEVVKACQEHLAGWSDGAFDDPRLQIVYADGREFVSQTRETWDVIIVDVTDLLKDGPSSRLSTLEFYEIARQRLAEQGILVVQGESVDPDEMDPHLAIFRTVSSVFPSVRVHSVRIPSFDEPWGFIVASNQVDFRLPTSHDVNRTMADRGCDGVRFYNGFQHFLMHSLPHYIRLGHSAKGQVISDDHPVFVITTNEPTSQEPKVQQLIGFTS